MVFFRPTIEITSDLRGHLDAVEVWEIHTSSAQQLVADSLSLRKESEHLVTTLDLTKQHAMAISKDEFSCGDGPKRLFEFRCPSGKKCIVKFPVRGKVRTGWFDSRFFI